VCGENVSELPASLKFELTVCSVTHSHPTINKWPFFKHSNPKKCKSNIQVAPQIVFLFVLTNFFSVLFQK
jgi:hypothetical protein